MKYPGKLFLIVGPSGSGKGTIMKHLKQKYSGFIYPVSWTTREMREGEEDGDVYHFVSKKEFEQLIGKDTFLEYAVVHEDNYYGTNKAEILKGLEAGAVVVREVDIQGFNSIAKVIDKENLVSIFLKVTDEDDLKGRILRRGAVSDEELEQRMESALKEIAQAGKCDYQVPNEWEKISECLREVEKIILNEIEGMY